jgi:integrative and conjugative element protein (TIGR02256 family)
MNKYYLKNGKQELIISDAVFRHFNDHRQIGSSTTEVGGQLFARIVKNQIFLERATGPTKFDARSRFSFAPNRLMEKITIMRMFKNGLHYIGDWHTHPEQIPTPSRDDLRSIKSTFEKSNHELAGILMIIVGQKCGSDGLYIAIQDHTGTHQIKP